MAYLIVRAADGSRFRLGPTFMTAADGGSGPRYGLARAHLRKALTRPGELETNEKGERTIPVFSKTVSYKFIFILFSRSRWARKG